MEDYKINISSKDFDNIKQMLDYSLKYGGVQTLPLVTTVENIQNQIIKEQNHGGKTQEKK